MSLISIIIVLLCYIYILKNPCEDWCSLYDTFSEIYDCCMCCKKALIEDNGKDEEQIKENTIIRQNNIEIEIIEEGGKRRIHL